MAVAAERLRQLGGGVMQQRHRDQVLLHAEAVFGDGGELLWRWPCKSPQSLLASQAGSVAADSGMDEGVHVGGVEVVLRTR